MPKNVQKFDHTVALISDACKVMLKILQARLLQYMNWEIPDVQARFRKGRGIKDQIATTQWIIEKAREFQKDICFVDSAKALTVHSEGDKPWDFFERNDAKADSLVLWPPHVKSWLIGKDFDSGRNWGQEKQGTTEDEMAGWHHWLNGGLQELVMDREA